MNQAKDIIMTSVRKMRKKAEGKIYEAKKLNKQADDLEKMANNNID